MPRICDKRERLVEAAKELIHHQGYNRTTLADIAEASDVPLGNVYYYFKSKDDLGAAVIDERRADFRSLIEDWERDPDPKARLLGVLDMLAGLRDTVAEHGCPIGSLCQELDKDRSHLAQRADSIIAMQLDWVTAQFERMGHEDAQALGAEFVGRIHGMDLLANALHDADVIETQVARLRSWLLAL